MERLGNTRPTGGLHAGALRAWGMLFVVAGIVSRGILQNQMLGVGLRSMQELMELMQASDTAMIVATIAIRNHLPQMARGIPTAETALNTGCVSAFRKTWQTESCIVLMNISGEKTEVDLSTYADWQLAASLSADGGKIKWKGDTLQLPPWGVAVLTPKE